MFTEILYRVRVGNNNKSMIIYIDVEIATTLEKALQAALNYCVARGCEPKILEYEVISDGMTFSKEGFDASMHLPQIDLDEALKNAERMSDRKYKW